jgi:hypothetical protein
MSKLCIVEGCSGLLSARGMCNTHYMQQRRAGLLPVGTRAPAPLEDRFFRNIEKTDACWLWKGRAVGKGYGMIGLGGKGAKQVLVHRLSYEIHKGLIPAGMVIMHQCDNPRCVNPDHLEAGTQSQNIKDAFSRGRKFNLPSGLKGESHGASKLTEQIVLDIRASKLSMAKLAALHGVAKSTIERIRYRKTWRHV